MDKLKEQLAQLLYKTTGGCLTEKEYLEMYGVEQRAWRIEGLPWDRFDSLELCEHQRDDYRWQAELILKSIVEDPSIKRMFLEELNK